MPASFALDKAEREPISAEEAKGELVRLLDGNALLKKGVDTSIFFPIVEKHFRAAIDAEMTFPSIRPLHLYMSDEGFLVVLTVLYGLLYGACRKVTAEALEDGECLALVYKGEPDGNFGSLSEAFSVPDKVIGTLRAIARAAGFTLTFGLSDEELELRFLFARFRAVPISTYSCSEEFVRDKMDRAMRWFMQSGVDFFNNL